MFSGILNIPLQNNTVMKKLIFFIVTMICFSACKSPKYLATPENFKYETKGLILSYEVSKDSTMLAEIIEVGKNTITLLPVNSPSPKLIEVKKNNIPEAEIIISLTSNNPKAISTWAGLLNIPFPTPVHLLINIPIMNDAAKGTYRTKYPQNVSWAELYKFARFPQGIPESIDRNDIM